MAAVNPEIRTVAIIFHKSENDAQSLIKLNQFLKSQKLKTVVKLESQTQTVKINNIYYVNIVVLTNRSYSNLDPATLKNAKDIIYVLDKQKIINPNKSLFTRFRINMFLLGLEMANKRIHVANTFEDNESKLITIHDIRENIRRNSNQDYFDQIFNVDLSQPQEQSFIHLVDKNYNKSKLSASMTASEKVAIFLKELDEASEMIRKISNMPPEKRIKILKEERDELSAEIADLRHSMRDPFSGFICTKYNHEFEREELFLLNHKIPSELRRLNAIEHEIEKLEAVIAERKSELKTKRALTPK